MSATTSQRAVQRRLESYRRADGNWRLKGLLLALSDRASAEAVGRAWPVQRPQTGRDLVSLGHRHPDTDEHAVARELYDADALQAAETVPRDDYIRRTLIADGVTELDVLWREEIHDTVMAGAATRKIAREATTVTNVGARRGDIPVRGQEGFASSSYEGAAGPFDEPDYSQVAYNCEKFEEGFALSDELVDQAEMDLLEEGIQQAGAHVENAINRQFLTNAVDNANQDQTVGANEATVQDVLEATENVADNDFDPVGRFVYHPELRTELADDPALSGANWEDTDNRDVGREGRAFGLNLYVGSDATYNGLGNENLNTSNTWGWEAGGEIGGVVFGADFVHTVVYQDIGVSELESPFTDIHDLQGGVASAWTDSVQASNDAISTITQ